MISFTQYHSCVGKMHPSCIVLFLLVTFTYFDVIFTQFAQTCSCVAQNQCYQNLNTTTPGGNDGSGLIDPRIVNPGTLVTIPPPPQSTLAPGQCPLGYDLCCSGPGVVGCGLRYNIPITPLTTPVGAQMKYGDQPWQIIIMDLGNSIIGGGALLDASNVLTAAHKVVNRTAGIIKIVAGEWDLTRTVEPYPIQESIVSQIRIHPNYMNVTNPNLQNDVALLRLATPIQFNSPAINSICLPTSAATNFDGQRCLVAGWGKDAFNGQLQNIPKEVDVPVVPYVECQARLRSTARLGPNFNLDPNSFLCAGGEPARDACTGDGGGALGCIVGGRYQLAGLVAWGIGCADNNVPGVYVKVSSFVSLIHQWMAT